ncbi:MAG: adenylate kinase [Planctomycetota bacterium]|nr:adenylate kinase [Planctomycetota bacterium]MDI6787483.1 adenylate kinase [Planctomycetota bacterium]
MIIVFLGAPGSGKGTQALMLADYLKTPFISTGDMLRDQVKQSSVLGLKAKAIMEQGELVPDNDVINMIKERVAQKDCTKGFVIDGFPRNSNQAKALDKAMMELGREVNKVVYLEIPQEVAIERNCGRRVCKNCRANYHIKYSPPKTDNKCDLCDQELYQRDDDKQETVVKRYQIYLEQTKNLVDYYQDRLISINGGLPIESIGQNIREKLKLAVGR